MLSRINSFFKRKEQKDFTNQPNIISIANLTIDRSAYVVYINNEPLTLPKKEFELVCFLAKNLNRVYSREELLKYIWGSDVLVLMRTVNVHIKRIRKKDW